MIYRDPAGLSTSFIYCLLASEAAKPLRLDGGSEEAEQSQPAAGKFVVLLERFLVAHLKPVSPLSSTFVPLTSPSLYLYPAKTLLKRLSRSEGAYEEQALFVSKPSADITFPRDSVEMKKDYFVFTCVFRERN